MEESLAGSTFGIQKLFKNSKFWNSKNTLKISECLQDVYLGTSFAVRDTTLV